VLQALVRDIVPPQEIKALINEREIAKQQIKSIEQQIIVAKTQADLATQTELGKQNQQIGQTNAQLVSVVKKAEQERDVAITKANQELAVAKLRLEAAQKEADAQIAKGQAEANVILLQRKAEAEPLRQQVQAFGDGNTYAQYFFFQKIAPSFKSILTTTDGPFADIFRQFITVKPESGKDAAKPAASAKSPSNEARFSSSGAAGSIFPAAIRTKSASLNLTIKAASSVPPALAAACPSLTAIVHEVGGDPVAGRESSYTRRPWNPPAASGSNDRAIAVNIARWTIPPPRRRSISASSAPSITRASIAAARSRAARLVLARTTSAI